MGQAQAAEKFDLESFLAWEAEQPERHEWVDGEIYAMTGARDAHNRISLKIAAALDAALSGTPCRTYMADMKLHVALSDSMFYPDVLVTCDPRDRLPEADLVKRHPSLIVEVISDSTGAYDRGRKFELYRSLPSLQEVMFVEQNRPQIDLFRRNAAGRWELFPAGEGEQLRLDSVGVDLSVAQVYQGVLPAVAAAAEPASGGAALL